MEKNTKKHVYMYVTKSPCYTAVIRQNIVSQLSVQFSSVTQLCPTFCNPMNCRTPGFSVHHQLPELTQTHVHRVGDAIQPFHPLSSPSRPTFNFSQHQGLFQYVISSHQVAKVLEVSASPSVLPVNLLD